MASHLSHDDFSYVIGTTGWRAAVSRNSPPEYRRRIAAAAVSYHTQLSSIDYVLKKYISADQYDLEEDSFGDYVSEYLRASARKIKQELPALHTNRGLVFGRFGADIALFKIPELVETATHVSDRGVSLEVALTLRLAIEMMAWSIAVFDLSDENKVRSLQPQNSISSLKIAYVTAGRIYGHLSELGHWKFDVHSHFLTKKDGRMAVLAASPKLRAHSLALCVLVVDVFIEVIRFLYPKRGQKLIRVVLGNNSRVQKKETHKLIIAIENLSMLETVTETRRLLC